MRSLVTALLLAIAFTPSQVVVAQTAKAPARKPATPAPAPAKSTPAAATTPAPAPCNCSPAMQVHIRPYIEMSRLTKGQSRPDGTTITVVTLDQVWRDEVGRTREESLRTLPDGTQYRNISVVDPIGGTQMSWSIGRPNTPDIVTAGPWPSSPTAPAPPPATANSQTNRTYFSRHTESLPSQMIAGLYAEGTLTTTITPAGTRGNDHDITSTQESWISPDTGIQLRNITDDSASGKMTAETTSIQFVAPDPAVFKAPDGYEVKYSSPKPAPAAAPACNCTTPTVTPRHFKPYSYKQKNTRVQILADGTTITTVSTAQMWRDTDGRTRGEMFSTGTDGALRHFVSVYDPVGGVRMSWAVDDPNVPKVVTLQHYPRPTVQPASPAPVNPQPAPRRYYPTTSETLPPQTIDGIFVGGNRYTRTIPAGYEGNDRDITTTQERWYSTDLGIQLRYIDDDPRTGKSTTEVTDVQQTAPDPTLFQPPAGYTIRDTNPQ